MHRPVDKIHFSNNYITFHIEGKFSKKMFILLLLFKFIIIILLVIIVILILYKL